MKDDQTCSHKGGGDAYILKSVVVNFNHTVIQLMDKTKHQNRVCETLYSRYHILEVSSKSVYVLETEGLILYICIMQYNVCSIKVYY